MEKFGKDKGKKTGKDMGKREVVVDLFHQVVWEGDGYRAVTDYTGEWLRTDVYRPDGVWIGCSGAENRWTILADVRIIVSWHKARVCRSDGAR